MVTLLKYCKIIILLGFLLNSITTYSQESAAYSKITSAVSKGDSHELSANFNQSISVKTDNSEGTYSKAQSEVLLSDFFSRNRPVSFSVSSKGVMNDNSEYIIGKFKTSKEIFRVYITLKQISAQKLIHQISFEKE